MSEIYELIDEGKNIYPIKPIIMREKELNLFHSKEEQIDYSLLTDGNISHIDTWMDKRAYEKDSFLEGCGVVLRFNFILDNANILILEKKYKEKKIKNIYINEDTIYKIINNMLYQVSINEYGNIKIKKMEKLCK